MTDISKNTELQQSCITAVKSRFFAQYWGQKVMKKNIEGLENFYSEPDGFIRSMTKDSLLFLELKSISNLSDNDAIKVSEIWGSKVHSKILGNIITIRIGTKAESEVRNSIGVIDFLRSKGYALPFMEYSVDDLISFGWVRLS